MPSRRRSTRDAVADATSVEEARLAAGTASAPPVGASVPPGPTGPGSGDPLVAELRRGGLLALLVLHFVGEEPSYGNRLMERIAELTGGIVAVNPNTMYPLLRDLEGRGLLAGSWEHPDRRSRRFYRLTAAGREESARLAGDLAPRLDALAGGIARIRAEVLAPSRER